jgi:acyl dehydratase
MVKTELTGTKLAEIVFPVERGKIREFANDICDTNPVHRDRQYARRQGFNDVLMPITFPGTFTFHLGSENAVMEIMEKLGMDAGKSVHGSFEVVYNQHVCAGQTLRGEVTVGKIYQKEGKRGGVMTFVEMEIYFYDAQDRLAVVVRNEFIERG